MSMSHNICVNTHMYYKLSAKETVLNILRLIDGFVSTLQQEYSLLPDTIPPEQLGAIEVLIECVYWV